MSARLVIGGVVRERARFSLRPAQARLWVPIRRLPQALRCAIIGNLQACEMEGQSSGKIPHPRRSARENSSMVLIVPRGQKFFLRTFRFFL
jgi:hypothetical protein